jgi:hypothetical protein
VVLAEELAARYGQRVNLLPTSHYVNDENVGRTILEADLVFCQPDNNATRLLVERHCGSLDNVWMFSGGNDDVSDPSGGTFGNVQIYLRENGQDLSNPPSTIHPEIAKPADHIPGSAGCAAQAPSAPQLLFTNAAVAAAQLGAFYAWRERRLDYEELYLDMASGRSAPVQRPVIQRPLAKRRRRGRGRASAAPK